MKHKSTKFNWSIPQKDGCEIYELFVNGDKTVQGRVAFKHIVTEGYTYLELIEAAPQNIGILGVYEGVGGHLLLPVSIVLRRGMMDMYNLNQRRN